MKNSEMDALDKAIVAMLSEDGRIPVKEIADKLGVTSPTVRARVDALTESGIIKIGALIDPSRIEEITSILIGICLEKGRWAQSFDEIANIEQVNWIVAVTGRYDLIAQFTFAGGIKGLYRILCDKLNKIKGVKSIETFVTMEARNKWVFVPRTMGIKWIEDHAVRNNGLPIQSVPDDTESD